MAAMAALRALALALLLAPVAPAAAAAAGAAVAAPAFPPSAPDPATAKDTSFFQKVTGWVLRRMSSRAAFGDALLMLACGVVILSPRLANWIRDDNREGRHPTLPHHYLLATAFVVTILFLFYLGRAPLVSLMLLLIHLLIHTLAFRWYATLVSRNVYSCFPWDLFPAFRLAQMLLAFNFVSLITFAGNQGLVSNLVPVASLLSYPYALCGHLDTACYLLEHGPVPPAGEVLAALQLASSPEDDELDWARCLDLEPDWSSLYVILVNQQPLTAEEWGMVITPCAGLGAALPAVLGRSAEEAALLVRHLPAAEQQNLRTAILCLARAQRQAGASLPTPIIWRILMQSAV